MAELDKNGADMTIEETFAALDDLIGRLEGGKGKEIQPFMADIEMIQRSEECRVGNDSRSK